MKAVATFVLVGMLAGVSVHAHTNNEGVAHHNNEHGVNEKAAGGVPGSWGEDPVHGAGDFELPSQVAEIMAQAELVIWLSDNGIPLDIAMAVTVPGWDPDASTPPPGARMEMVQPPHESSWQFFVGVNGVTCETVLASYHSHDWSLLNHYPFIPGDCVKAVPPLQYSLCLGHGPIWFDPTHVWPEWVPGPSGVGPTNNMCSAVGIVEPLEVESCAALACPVYP